MGATWTHVRAWASNTTLPDIDWVPIPALDEQGHSAFPYQDGTHDGLPDFWIARYPITYAQFQAFVDDPEGFRNPHWWEEPVRLAASDDHRSAPGDQLSRSGTGHGNGSVGMMPWPSAAG